MAGLGHPCKFQRVSRLGFVSAAPSLTGGQPNIVRCLAVSWAGTLYIHFRGLLPPDGILPGAKFTLRPSLAFSYMYWQRFCTVLQQPAFAKLCGVVQGMELRNFRRRRHLYSAGRPSRWALAHLSSSLNAASVYTTIEQQLCA